MIAGLKTHARLAAILAASAILVAVAAIALPPLTQGEEPMATSTATRPAAIPKTTVQPPAVVETATFAMG